MNLYKLYMKRANGIQANINIHTLSLKCGINVINKPIRKLISRVIVSYYAYFSSALLL